jgi:hypothetical protein
MTSQQSAHLSEEALDDALIGLSSPETEAHLAMCEFCHSQMEEFRSELRLFNQTSLAWSEARPAKSVPVNGKSKFRHAMQAPLGWALAAAVFLAIGVPVWNYDHRLSPHLSSSTAKTPEDTEAQIAQDNDLLRSVDAALSAPEASPLNEYNLSNGPHTRLKPRPELRK